VDGSKVKRLRIERRHRAVQFAQMVGITTAWLRMIENGSRNPSPIVAGLIADALKLDVSEILQDEPNGAAA
jgi:transcriptional regulator with XRE-family HTH domain